VQGLLLQPELLSNLNHPAHNNHAHSRCQGFL
jgi:hypothetical protein